MKSNSELFVERKIPEECKVNPETTFSNYAGLWIEINGLQLAAKTLSRYKKLLERINAGIGHIPLIEITTYHIIKFEHNLMKDGMNYKSGGKLSPKTILHHHRLISVILQAAVRQRVIECNPASVEFMKSPRVPKKEAKCLQVNEVQKILNFAKILSGPNLRTCLAIYIALFCGLRRGEICALKWSSIDLESNLINVNCAAAYTQETGLYIKEPKTETSERQLYFSESLLSEKILEYKKFYSDNYGDPVGDNFLFCQRENTKFPVHPDTITDWIAKFRKAFSLSLFSPQILRHTYVSLQIANNTPIKEISHNVGHALLSTTCDIYAHYIKPSAAPETLEHLLGLIAM